MDYSNDGIKLKKMVLDTDGHLYEVDFDTTLSRCPECGDKNLTPINKIHFYRFTRIVDAVGLTPINYVVIAPDTTTRVHLTFSAVCEYPIVREFYEGCSIDAGDKIAEMDNNRDDPSPSELQVFENPLLNGDGNKLYERRITNGLDALSKSITPETESILKQTEAYLIRITPEFDSKVSTIIRWAEVK